MDFSRASNDHVEHKSKPIPKSFIAISPWGTLIEPSISGKSISTHCNGKHLPTTVLLSAISTLKCWTTNNILTVKVGRMLKRNACTHEFPDPVHRARELKSELTIAVVHQYVFGWTGRGEGAGQ